MTVFTYCLMKKKKFLVGFKHKKCIISLTRMKTSISSKAFCSITDRQTDKIGAISQLGAEKITFPPKPDIHTDRHTYIQTDGHLLL